MNKELIKQETNWFKKSQLVLQFHEDKIKQFGNKRGEKWTIKKTADALDLSIGYVSEALILAKLRNVEGLSRDLALKVVRLRAKNND